MTTGGEYDIRSVETRTHGRVLISQPAAPPEIILIGFHGYAENAAMQMHRLERLRGHDAGMMLVSVQALHCFYQGKTRTVAASWMVREEREQAIEDNVAYVDAVLRSLGHIGTGTSLVCAGFSQGVAMAFRSGVRGAFRCAGIVAVGGDVPPELLADPSAVFPPVLLTRGDEDQWFTQARMDADVAALEARGVNVETAVLPGGHEWTDEVTSRVRAFIRGAHGASAHAASRLPPPSATS